MLIRLRPRVTPESILHPLQRVLTAVRNLETGHFTDGMDRWAKYVQWTDDSIRALRYVIAADALESLIRTPVFWNIHTMPPLAAATNATIATEVTARREDLEQLHTELTAMTQRWSAVKIVVPDTSMLFRHGNLDQWDLAADLNLAEDEPVHIVIPMVVIDELDRLKEASNKATRWLARYSTAVIDRVLPDPRRVGELRPRGYESGRGPVTLEVLLDPPGHIPVPDADDELVDQAASVNGLAIQPVTVLTYDTGQSMRARGRALRCFKFADPPEPDEPSRRQVRREKAARQGS